MINDLINDNGLSFCMSCGRLLYLTEPEVANTRRSASARNSLISYHKWEQSVGRPPRETAGT